MLLENQQVVLVNLKSFGFHLAFFLFWNLLNLARKADFKMPTQSDQLALLVG